MLPLVLHVAGGASLDRALEILREEGWVSVADSQPCASAEGSKRVILHDPVTACGSDVSIIRRAVGAGFFFVVTAAGITDPDVESQERACACVSVIPPDRLLCGTDSPWRTPQNLPDPYLRTLRNEPCNMSAVVQAAAKAVGRECDIDFISSLKGNAMSVYGMESLVTKDDHTTALATSKATEQLDALELTARGSLTESSAVLEEMRSQEDGLQADESDAAHPDGVAQVVIGNDAKVSEVKAVAEEEVLNSDPSRHTSAQAAASVEGGDTEDATRAYFGCQRCRSHLFFKDQVIHHAHDAVRTVFKVGEEGLCATAVFVQGSDGLFRGGGLAASEGGHTIECASCGWKLGKYYEIEASCPCGAVVKGPTARMMASKMDYFDGIIDPTLLSARARIEMEDVLAQAEHDDQESDPRAGKSLKKKKKKIKSDNRGNFSYFRNKTFVPNASRGTKAELSKSSSVQLKTDVRDESSEEESDGDGHRGGTPLEGIREHTAEIESDEDSDD